MKSRGSSSRRRCKMRCGTRGRTPQSLDSRMRAGSSKKYAASPASASSRPSGALCAFWSSSRTSVDTSPSRAIVEVDHAISKTVFGEELELDAQTFREGRFADSNECGRDEQLEFVDQTRLDRVCRQLG